MIPYEDLEKHFTLPLGPDKKPIVAAFYSCYNYKRVPRKLKKKYRKIFSDKDYTIPVALWYILEFENPDYKRFLIKECLKHC